MNKLQLRRFIKLAVQPLFKPWIPFKLRRLLMQGGALLQRKQAGVQRQQLRLNGIDTYQAAAEQPNDLHILYLHGGGYVFGGVSTHRQIVDGLALIGQARVSMPAYRLAPEHPFPAALDDALAAYQALLADGVAADNIVVAGDSAGGGLALALALQLRDTGQPLPSALILFSPWLDLTVSLPSHTANQAIDPMLLTAGLHRCAKAYCAATPRDHQLCSPLFADLTGLPPMIIQVGSDEILLDDALELDKRASAAGVDTELTVFSGLWHVFQLHSHQLPEATQALADVFNSSFIKDVRG